MPYRVVNDRRAWIAIAVGTLAIEVLTLILRFGAKMDSTRDTASTVGRLTMGMRIHHGYVGLLLVLVYFALSDQYPRLARAAVIAGGCLLFSDVIHHFAVVWPVTGSPKFDFWYHMGG